jgi:HD-GYP domain-containing protein (c-di-GMP phosphodiesterase class II)
MFYAIAVLTFAALLVWTRKRAQVTQRELQQLRGELQSTQIRVEEAERRATQIIGLLSELHEYKIGPAGRVSLQELADFSARTTSLLLGMARVVMLRWDPVAGVYRGIAGQGFAPQELVQLQIKPGDGLLGKAAQGGKLIIESVAAPGSADPLISAPYLILPLWVNSQVQAILAMCRPASGRISSEAVRVAALLGKHLELTLENLDLYENRQQVYAEVVGALADALAAKDRDSQSHTEQCQLLIRRMASQMKLPASLIEQFEFGALLHDLGKLGIEEAILAKPGPLTEDEQKVVRKHPEIGFHLLRGIGFLKAVAPIVLYHHEWVNGQGYPEGLAGEEIPLGARMLAIADAWQTMVNDQPYRKALQKNAAVAELRQQAGTQFDPKLVDVFLRVIEQLERSEAKPAAAASNE